MNAKFMDIPITTSTAMPLGTFMLVTPGRYVDVSMPGGKVVRVEEKPPSMVYVKNVGV